MGMRIINIVQFFTNLVKKFKKKLKKYYMIKTT